MALSLLTFYTNKSQMKCIFMATKAYIIFHICFGRYTFFQIDLPDYRLIEGIFWIAQVPKAPEASDIKAG